MDSPRLLSQRDIEQCLVVACDMNPLFNENTVGVAVETHPAASIRSLLTSYWRLSEQACCQQITGRQGRWRVKQFPCAVFLVDELIELLIQADIAAIDNHDYSSPEYLDGEMLIVSIREQPNLTLRQSVLINPQHATEPSVRTALEVITRLLTLPQTKRRRWWW